MSQVLDVVQQQSLVEHGKRHFAGGVAGDAEISQRPEGVVSGKELCHNAQHVHRDIALWR